MKHLPITGASIATPALGENELKRALDELGVKEFFDDTEIRALYTKIAAVYGAWFSEQEIQTGQARCKSSAHHGEGFA